MNKKGLTIGMTALLIGALMIGVAGSVSAQTETPQVETLPAPEVTRQPFGRGFGMGPVDEDADGIPDHWQAIQNGEIIPPAGLGFGLGASDGSCDADGDGIPDQLRLRDGSVDGNQYGMGRRGGMMGFGAGQGAGAGRGAGGAGMGMGPGQGRGDGMGLRDGSCLDD